MPEDNSISSIGAPAIRALTVCAKACPTSDNTKTNPDNPPASSRAAQGRSGCFLPESQDIPAHKASKLPKKLGLTTTGVFNILIIDPVSPDGGEVRVGFWSRILDPFLDVAPAMNLVFVRYPLSNILI
jgi:hypothetical protein